MLVQYRLRYDQSQTCALEYKTYSNNNSNFIVILKVLSSHHYFHPHVIQYKMFAITIVIKLLTIYCVRTHLHILLKIYCLSKYSSPPQTYLTFFQHYMKFG